LSVAGFYVPFPCHFFIGDSFFRLSTGLSISAIMNLRQIKSLCEIVDRDLRISAAAKALHRSQPSLTRQIQELETELGVQIFIRRANRIVDVTRQGREIVAIARRMVQDAISMRIAGQDQGADAKGELRLAITHTQARYALPRIIRKFMRSYPRVKLNMRQGDPEQCCELVEKSMADVAICAEVRSLPRDVIQVPCYRITRSVITPARHPLLRVRPLTLEAIARYPIITYDAAFSGRRIVDKAFADRGLEPTVVLSAADGDVSKAYVEMEAGIAILATIVFNAKRDVGLRRLDASHLFPSSTLAFVLRRNAYIPSHTLAFMQLFAPAVRKSDVLNALAGRPLSINRSDLPKLQ
jgi:LysR family cys regulon transcriptional activator